MLWIINGLVYGFFMALYTLVNQRHKFNGYVLGVWRGFGISFLFLPFLFFVPLQTDLKNWYLLVIQGLLIGIYDSHIFFASARYGASVWSFGYIKIVGIECVGYDFNVVGNHTGIVFGIGKKGKCFYYTYFNNIRFLCLLLVYA